MARSSSASFILELALVIPPAADRIVLGQFEAGRRLFNAVLDESFNRLDLMRQSKAWQTARALPKGKARSDAFRACNKRFGFAEYDLHAAATAHKNAAGWQDRLGAHETQKIATRVFKAVQEYAFDARGRPRFKSQGRLLHSLEGKTNRAGIRWNAETGCIAWGKLVLPAMLPSKNQDAYLHEGLLARTKYCRIVWRMVRGQRRWFVQLVQEGAAPAKYAFHAAGQIVGLDIGPSTVAIVSDEAVALEHFAPSVEQPWAETRRLQRAMDRSRRAMNPANYDEQGRAKKGPNAWKKSERYKRLCAGLAETERRLAARRAQDHGTLANKIIGLGNVVQAEKLSYKAFQACFGRSVKVRAPGAFVSILSRRAESAGGKLVELDTRRLRMSQYDHLTGACEKKPLSQRWHRLGGANSTLVQRDCYSAFLAKHATGSGHNPIRLQEGWGAAEPLLKRAGLCLEQSAIGLPSGSPTVVIPSERIARQKRFVRGLGQNVVGSNPESPETPRMHAFRTHGL